MALVRGLEGRVWMIMNGQVEGDEEAKWTYIGGRGKSVIDYVMGYERVWEMVVKLRVGEQIDSDHHPVMVRIKGRGVNRKTGK